MAKITIRNKTAHVEHINLGGGQQIAVPPTEQGVTATFEDGDRAGLERVQKALGTKAMKRKIERGELEVEGDLGAGSSAAAPQASMPAPAQASTPVPRRAPEPSTSTRTRGDKE